MTAASPRLAVADHEHALVVTLDRPEARNAVDLDMVTELHAVCAQLEAEPRVLVITGAGTVFAAGADIAQLRERGRLEALQGINSRLFHRVAALPMPTIAALNGPAIGAGAELAYACDFRIGTPSATFANPEIGLGIMAAAGGCWRLKELAGEPLAKQVLLGGLTVGAELALARGLLGEVVEPEALLDAALLQAKRISRSGPLAVRLTKLALRTPPSAHPYVDDLAQAVLFETEDKHARMTAFLERPR